MARQLVVTDRYSSAWENLFTFWLNTKSIPELAALKAMGAHKVSIRIGCTSPSRFFADLVEVVAEKGVAVDALWLKAVRDLCESMNHAIIGELQRATSPDDEDPDGHKQEAVAAGNYLLYVSVRWDDAEVVSSVDFCSPAAGAEAGSAGAKREPRKLTPRRWGYPPPAARSDVSTAAE